MRNRTGYLALVLAAAALFVSVGGPAFAADAVTAAVSGKSIRAKSITGRQLAPGAVTMAKIGAAAKAGLRGPAGPAGPAGAGGAKGATGPAGDTGRIVVQDALGRPIGVFAGFFNNYTTVLTPAGALLTYDSTTPDGNPLPFITGPLYYKAAGCAGQAYASYPPSYPVNTAIILASPPVAGSPIYKMTPATTKNFTSVSRRTAAGCAPAATSVSNALPADAAGVVPTVQKPTVLIPTG